MPLKIQVYPTKAETGHCAALKAAELLKTALAEKKRVRFIAATGASQFEFLESLCRIPGIDWPRTEMFHLDEYVGIPPSHPASFRRYLTERLVSKVHPGTVHFIEGDAPDPAIECARISKVSAAEEIDVAFVGIGENGHLAFNDPPADFETDVPYFVVTLDEACRRQQLGEGWFKSLEEVPRQAISMSITQIMKAKTIICTCPDDRKANAVRDCLSENAPVTPLHPSSIIKQHPRVFVFLDSASASKLDQYPP